MNIHYSTKKNPFIIRDCHIVTPICTRGYTGAPILKIILKKIGVNANNIRNPYGIIADPKYVDPNVDFTFVVKKSVSSRVEGDEFVNVFEDINNSNLQNFQTIILEEMNVSQIERTESIYVSNIVNRVWNFSIDNCKEQRVFIIMSMDDNEINTVIKNVTSCDIIVVLKTYNLALYPLNGIIPLSYRAYEQFITVICDCFRYQSI